MLQDIGNRLVKIEGMLDGEGFSLAPLAALAKPRKSNAVRKDAGPGHVDLHYTLIAMVLICRRMFQVYADVNRLEMESAEASRVCSFSSSQEHKRTEHATP